MTIKIKIDAEGKKVLAQIGRIPIESRNAIRKGWYFVGKELQKEARKNIIEGPKTGKLYRISGRKKRHRASAPGESPANLSGSLQKSVDFIVKGWDRMTFGAGSSKLLYARPLELGSKRIKPRPYLIKAINSKEKETKNILDSAVRRALTK